MISAAHMTGLASVGNGSNSKVFLWDADLDTCDCMSENMDIALAMAERAGEACAATHRSVQPRDSEVTADCDAVEVLWCGFGQGACPTDRVVPEWHCEHFAVQCPLRHGYMMISVQQEVASWDCRFFFADLLCTAQVCKFLKTAILCTTE